jgi:hypothetical protein
VCRSGVALCKFAYLKIFHVGIYDL